MLAIWESKVAKTEIEELTFTEIMLGDLPPIPPQARTIAFLNKEVGTTVQPQMETVTKNYVADYLSLAGRDIFVTEAGSFTQRYVYDAGGTKLSAEFSYADGTARGAVNSDGEYGEKIPASDPRHCC